ncbi:MAG: nitrate reductase cytochrome c-type subunit; periplasmic nitrate reductase electron transfer subunit [Woeseiaceae bacterium]|nr:nitrate reductase cytochrome c-type subunit; periplasmic nitrate reductase electron transfer subunit [Woeseiaceae bacterium]
MKQKTNVTAFLVLALSLFLGVATADEIATLRHGTPIDSESDPAAIPQVFDGDIKTKRNYPMQPPLIPHDTRDYDVNLQANKCMSCHARRRTEESQAPMISVTHYMDREGNFLAEISPRRYFCNQCHVNQTMTREVLENDFQDMDELIEERAAKSKDD